MEKAGTERPSTPADVDELKRKLLALLEGEE
jgi:hypothetical protein